MLFGVLAFFIFLLVATSSVPSMESAMHPKRWQTVQKLGYIAFVFVMLHLITMGTEGWLKPTGWPGGLLPISLVAFTIIALTLLVRILVLILPKQKEEKL